MAVTSDKSEAADRETPRKVVFEDETCTIVSLCDDLSQVRDASAYVAECCAPCPSYTTVPCSC